jgi:hypothetical protein
MIKKLIQELGSWEGSRNKLMDMRKNIEANVNYDATVKSYRIHLRGDIIIQELDKKIAVYTDKIVAATDKIDKLNKLLETL